MAPVATKSFPFMHSIYYSRSLKFQHDLREFKVLQTPPSGKDGLRSKKHGFSDTLHELNWHHAVEISVGILGHPVCKTLFPILRQCAAGTEIYDYWCTPRWVLCVLQTANSIKSMASLLVQWLLQMVDKAEPEVDVFRRFCTSIAKIAPSFGKGTGCCCDGNIYGIFIFVLILWMIRTVPVILIICCEKASNFWCLFFHQGIEPRGKGDQRWWGWVFETQGRKKESFRGGSCRVFTCRFAFWALIATMARLHTRREHRQFADVFNHIWIHIS